MPYATETIFSHRVQADFMYSAKFVKKISLYEKKQIFKTKLYLRKDVQIVTQHKQFE